MNNNFLSQGEQTVPVPRMSPAREKKRMEPAMRTKPADRTSPTPETWTTSWPGPMATSEMDSRHHSGATQVRQSNFLQRK
jgi:hypothetical protein